MTYKSICDILKNAGIEEYGFESALLISHFCRVPREQLFFRRDEDFVSDELCAAVELRATRYPLQYVLGEWEFCTEKYKVGKGCLIPRQETEFIVEYAACQLTKNATFLDLCTGSGCIAISTLVRRPDCRAVGVDFSPLALSYAEENASLNGVRDRVSFILCDLLEGNAHMEVCGERKFDAIISNPPYIPTDTVDTLEKELFAEPREALDGGGDGLIFYRTIVKNFAPYLADGGFMLFEIGDGQGEALRAIAEKNGFDFHLEHDLAGKERNVILTR